METTFTTSFLLKRSKKVFHRQLKILCTLLKRKSVGGIYKRIIKLKFSIIIVGNYYRLEIDFVSRTLDLIEQYNSLKEQFPFERQYNHTLLTNCLLGLIVLPKEKALSHIPKTRIAFVKALKEWGVNKSSFNPDIKDTKELFLRLRNAVAHFDIEFISETEEHLIDRIEFRDTEAGIDIATFYADEFSLFIKFYAITLLRNLERHR